MHLGIAATTVSLMVGELSRKGILERLGDDRRHRIVSITEEQRPVIHVWLARGAAAWPGTLTPITPAERRTLVDTLVACDSGRFCAGGRCRCCWARAVQFPRSSS
jgi:DNA-binding MarR family transcriptional regulator